MKKLLQHKRVKSKMFKAGLTMFFGVASSVGVMAQDIHFSQWELNPLELNPGMAGVINSNLRVSATYRDQWKGLAPFTTMKAAVDGNINLKDNGRTKLTVGGLVFNDKAGDVELKKLQLTAYLGALMELNRNSEFSVAINGGLFQRSLNSNKMIWDAQYVGGQYDPTNPNFESDIGYAVNSGDIGAGMAYRWWKDAGTLSSNDFMQFIGGIGFQHLNRPNLTIRGIEDRTFRKLTAHADLHIGIQNTNFSIRPGIFYARQGPYRETVAGAYYSVLVREASKRTGFIQAVRVSFGTHVRLGDAIIPSLLLEMGSYKLGFAYDFTYSKLSGANEMKGGFEISFMYLNPSGFYYKKNQPGGVPLM